MYGEDTRGGFRKKKKKKERIHRRTLLSLCLLLCIVLREKKKKKMTRTAKQKKKSLPGASLLALFGLSGLEKEAAGSAEESGGLERSACTPRARGLHTAD